MGEQKKFQFRISCQACLYVVYQAVSFLSAAGVNQGGLITEPDKIGSSIAGHGQTLAADLPEMVQYGCTHQSSLKGISETWLSGKLKVN
jgi:hypothetical protein